MIYTNINGCKTHRHDILLIGTKIDKRGRIVGREEAKKFAFDNQLLYIEINALNCEMLDNAMKQLANQAIIEIGDDKCRGFRKITGCIEIDDNKDNEKVDTKTCCVIM